LGSRIAVTSLKSRASGRRDWTMEQRRAEIAAWAERLASPVERDAYMQAALNTFRQKIGDLGRANRRLEVKLAKAERKLDAMRKSFSWRLTRLFRVAAKRLRGRKRR
jgi:septal ring factor EnvC (AmiA/AmiB activator)